jgi:hypothetical protein
MYIFQVVLYIHSFRLNLCIYRTACDIYIVVFDGSLLVIFILDTTVWKILDLQTYVAGCLCCWDCIVIFFQEFVRPRQTASWHYYRETLQGLREQVLRKVAQKWRNGDWLACGDNAQTHTGLSVQNFVSTKSVALASPYSTLLTRVVWPLRLPGMASILATRASFPETIADRLYTIPKFQFQRCFQQVRKCWARCITPKGTTYLVR